MRPDEGIPRWLLTEGRLLHRGEVAQQLRTPGYLDIQREMQALKALVSIPLMASGTLIGILNLGERVTGAAYTDDELEILFSLASHMAVGIQDIALHHTAQAQQTFTEKILRYMSSGVLSIGGDEKISLCNHRAAQILGTAWDETLQQDLRCLPSPLGDMLYETLRDGTTYLRQEVVLASADMPLEVSTYQVFDESGQVVGSVMVFEDLTAKKLLYEERRRADQLDFLNKVVGRMAHEIKNPLVSIQTFAELLADHYDDPEFRDNFRTVVSHDVQAVDSITEKLVSFASKIDYHFASVDVPTLPASGRDRSCPAAYRGGGGALCQPWRSGGGSRGDICARGDSQDTSTVSEVGCGAVSQGAHVSYCLPTTRHGGGGQSPRVFAVRPS